MRMGQDDEDDGGGSARGMDGREEGDWGLDALFACLGVEGILTGH